MTTKRQVISYVRNRDAMSAAEKAELFDPKNLPTVKRMLIELKQDIDAQFIACDARLADMRATAATAEREDPDKPIKIQMGTDDDDRPVYEEHPPSIAKDVFEAKELRWQVRTKRFGYLIDSAIEDVQEAINNAEDERLATLLAAVERHKAEMEGDAGEEDEELYAVAENLKTRTA